MKLLDSINSPRDLRKLAPDQLPLVAAEIRELMIDVVSRTGGHLASSLGAVDLALALHYCYDTPDDKLIWDVGHQAYAHKIITGRRDSFTTLRQHGGISGFPRISESEYDVVSVGHASTSISAGLGIAKGRDLKNENHAVVAIIGDGSLSGGLALEGMNNLGSSSTNFTIVLNDNEMSISRNVGALSGYLTRVITDKRYNKIKSEIWELLGNLSNVGKGIRSLVSNIDDGLKHMLIPGKLFEDMGLRYIGPIDGHNFAQLTEVFMSARTLFKEPVLIHVLTKKGKGYSFAENDATKYHGVSCFSPVTGDVVKKPTQKLTYSDVFGKTIVELAHGHKEVVAITAAMCDGTRLLNFRQQFPDRFFDVGIAESHAVTFAAGLALKGLRPIVVLYSTFLQRAYDQIMHDVALDKLPVIFCIDRAGLVGDDGPTHHGMFDLSFLRSVPGAIIMAPRNESLLRTMLCTAVGHSDGPVFIRYPRGSGDGAPIDGPMQSIPIGTAEILREGKGCAIVAIGDFCARALTAASLLDEQGIDATVVDARFVKPLDQVCIAKILETHDTIITLENNSLSCGFGSALLELAASLPLVQFPRILRLGLPDAFVTHGESGKLLLDLGLDPGSIAETISNFVAETKKLLIQKASTPIP